MTKSSGSGMAIGSGSGVISGVRETSRITAATGSWVKAGVTVAGTVDGSDGVWVGLALTSNTSTPPDLGAGTVATETEFSGKLSVEKNAPAVPSELLDPSFNTDEKMDPAEVPPTTKVVSTAAVSFEEVFTT